MSPDPKPVLIFVPGLGTTSVVYEPFLESLKKYYEVRPADSQLPFPATLDWDFFCNLIDQAAGNATSFVLLGNSLGASIVLKYAAEHPDRVGRTVAVSPVLFPFTRPRQPHRRLKSFLMSLRASQPRHFFVALRERRRMLGNGGARKLYGFARHINLTDELAQLARTTILWAEHEEVIPRTQFEYVRDTYPNITTQEIPGSHNNLALNPQPVQDLVRQALDG